MELSKRSDREILSVVEPIMDRLMAASTVIDYAAHVADFTERAKTALPASAFRVVCERYQAEKGFFAERDVVAIFRRPDSLAVVWRQSFTRARGEFVAELVLVERDGRHQVDHVMVF